MESSLHVEGRPTDPTTRMHKRRDIQGLRALAVLLVLTYHADLPVPGGFVGVDVFLVVSGFVITAMLLRQWRRDGKISMTTFYLQRFKRLTPALAAVVTFTMVTSALLLSPFGTQQNAALTGIGAMLLTANVVIPATSGGYFDAPADTNPLLNTWSLSLEEQFYLAFPTLLLAALVMARGRTRPDRLVVALLLLATGMSLLAALWGASSPADWGRGVGWLLGFFSPLTRAWEFGVGALLAFVAPNIRSSMRSSMRRSAAALGGATGLVLVAISALVISDSTVFPSQWTVLPVAGTALVIWAGTVNPSNRVSRTLGVGTLVFIGDRSYSIYLWHWPFIVFAGQVFPTSEWALTVGAIVSFLPALILFQWLEEPLRRATITDWANWLRLIGIVLLVPLCTAVALLLGAERGWGYSPIQRAQQAASEEHVGWSTCLDQSTNGAGPSLDFDDCQFGSSGSGAPVYLVGDSNAAHLSTGVFAAAESVRRPMIVRTAAGCAFLDGYRVSGNVSTPADKNCRSYYESTMDAIISGPPATVIIAESASQWLLPGRGIGISPETVSGDLGNRSEAIAQGLALTVNQLRDSGHEVILALPLTSFSSGPSPSMPACATTISILLGRCPATVPLTDIDGVQQELRDQVRDVAEGNRARVLDLEPFQCPGGICPSEVDGGPIYKDSGHLSVEFSRSIAPVVEELLSLGLEPPHSEPK